MSGSDQGPLSAMENLKVRDEGTPTEDAESQESITSTTKVFRFFDLPRELRDHIYGCVLVPGYPIEFAPLTPKKHSEFWEEDEDGAHILEYDNWNFKRYRDKIRPALRLLRVNKQINDEAAPIYYEQPFRFTNQAGWWIIAHWLEHIGYRNRALVKDITICHPGFADSPYQPYDAYQLLYCQMLLPLGLPTIRKFGYDRWGRNSSYEWMFNHGHADPDATGSLRSMHGLKKLQLVLHYRAGVLRFSRLQRPLIHQPLALKSYPNRQSPPNITLLNLIRFRPGIDEQFKLEDFLGDQRRVDELERLHFGNLEWHDWYHEARHTLQQLQSAGFKMTDVFYDIHVQYPTDGDVVCVNKERCMFYKHRDHADGLISEEELREPCRDWESMDYNG